MKTQMLQSLGEAALMLPAQVNAALAANDRLKYYFALLQLARGCADQPDRPAPSLRQERLAAGIEDGGLDGVIAGTRKENGFYRLPRDCPLLARIAEDARIMAAPAGPDFAERLQPLLRLLPDDPGQPIRGADIDAWTRAPRPGVDSLHGLVMDLHKAINRLQAGLAETTIDGAATYRLASGDGGLVRAFMAGLNRTAPLKFDHPGLATTATRSGSRLIIQNDIGTTDAHVIVIHVAELEVSVTYSDVHLERLHFLQRLLPPFEVSWSLPAVSEHAPSGKEAGFFLATGSFAARDPEDLRAYLEHLGSRLVFLIDWNRARKELRGFLKGEQRLALLHWAAEAEIGHRAFLQLGGAHLLWDAMEAASPGTIHLGDRLTDVLGPDSAFAFIKFVFTAASSGLRAHQSDSLIRNRIRAELLDHLQTAETHALEAVASHAGYIFELAISIRDRLFGAPPEQDQPGDWLANCRRWEHAADLLVVVLAQAAQRRPELEPLLRLIDSADDAADGLEEAAFMLSLAPDPDSLPALQDLAALLAETAQEWVKAACQAPHITRHGPREDADRFLVAIDRIGALEHQADDAERAVAARLIGASSDFRELHVLSEIWHRLGEASDSLMRAGLKLRDHVVGRILAA